MNLRTHVLGGFSAGCGCTGSGGGPRRGRAWGFPLVVWCGGECGLGGWPPTWGVDEVGLPVGEAG